MDIYDKIKECSGFQWDKYNVQKIWERHKVTPVESEQAFFNSPLIIIEDIHHSQEEERFYALGKPDQNLRLFIVFTLRQKFIRVIFSRDMSKKERRIYKNG